MENKINIIKKQIKKEAEILKFAPHWFYKSHLLAVEEFAKLLLKKLPKADKEIVMLGVWLHDLQRIRGIKGDHMKIGASEAEKMMAKHGYDKKIIRRVKEIILTHSCSKKLPQSMEGKILASADAMSHYVNNFYLEIAVLGERNLKEYKKWALEKLNRDFKKKIFFGFAKKIIKKRHDILINLFTMN